MSVAKRLVEKEMEQTEWEHRFHLNHEGFEITCKDCGSNRALVHHFTDTATIRCMNCHHEVEAKDPED